MNARKREDLLLATEAILEEIARVVRRPNSKLRGQDRINRRVGREANRRKVEKHFRITVSDNNLTWARDPDSIAAEARLDGIYIVRTSLPAEAISAHDAVYAYKSLAQIERAFRNCKSTRLDFGLRVRKSGRKNYVLQTRVRGKLCWFTIGQHGRITADEARAWALEILAQAKKGIDPPDADAKREAEPVMADLGRRFLDKYVPVHCKPTTQGEYRRSVELFIDPAIGELRIAEVERKDIAKLHFDLRDKPYQANLTLGVLSKMFSLAEIWGLRPDGSNPCRHVKRYK